MSDDADIRARSGPPRRTRFGGLRMPGAAAARRPHFRVGAVVAVAVAAGLVAWLVLHDDGGSSNARTQSGRDRDEASGHRDTGPVRRASDLLARTEARHDLRGHAGRERKDLRALPAVGCRRRLFQAVPHCRHVSLPRHLRGHPEAGARQGRGHRAARGRRCRRAGRRLPAERPHRLPARGLPGRGLRPDAGARDATRVVGAAQEHRQPRGDDRRQDQHEAHGRDARGPPDARATGRPPDLLGRPQAWLHVRAEHHLERERVHPLPPRRREGRRPEGALSDRCHVPVSGRLRRGDQGRHGRGRRRHHQARPRRDRRRRRQLPEEHPPRLSRE